MQAPLTPPPSQELYRIAELSPFKTLPRFAIPKPEQYLQPPILHCGWFIDVEDFRLRAAEKQLALMQLDTEDSSSDDLVDDTIYPEELVDPVAEREATQAADDFRMCIALVDAVMDELGLVLHLNSYVVAGRGLDPSVPESRVRVGFSLYTNYSVRDRPSEEVIQTVREALGFEGEPMWFMDGVETRWVYDPSM